MNPTSLQFKKMLEDSETKFADINSLIDGLDEAVTQLRGSNSEAVNSVTNMQNELIAYQEKTEKASTLAKTNESKIAECQNSIDTNTSSLTALQANLKDVKDTADNAAQKTDDNSASITKLQEKSETLEADIKDLRKTSTDNNADLSTKLETTNGILSEVASELEKATDSIKAHDEELQKSSQNETEINSKIDSLTKTTTDLRTDVDKNKDEITNTQNDLNTTKTNVDTLTAAVGKIQNNVTSIQEDLGQKTETITGITNDIEAINKKADEQEKNLATLKSGTETSIQNLKDEQGRIEESLETITTINDAVSKIKQDVTGLVTANTTLNDMATKNKDDIGLLKNSTEELKNTLTEVENTSNTSSNDIFTLTKTVNDLSVNTKEIEKTANAAKSASQKASNNIDVLQKKQEQNTGSIKNIEKNMYIRMVETIKQRDELTNLPTYSVVYVQEKDKYYRYIPYNIKKNAFNDIWEETTITPNCKAFEKLGTSGDQTDIIGVAYTSLQDKSGAPYVLPEDFDADKLMVYTDSAEPLDKSAFEKQSLDEDDVKQVINAESYSLYKDDLKAWETEKSTIDDKVAAWETEHTTWESEHTAWQKLHDKWMIGTEEKNALEKQLEDIVAKRKELEESKKQWELQQEEGNNEQSPEEQNPEQQNPEEQHSEEQDSEGQSDNVENIINTSAIEDTDNSAGDLLNDFVNETENTDSTETTDETSSTEAPAETPAENAGDTPTETPIENAGETPVETPTETTPETPTETEGGKGNEPSTEPPANNEQEPEEGGNTSSGDMPGGEKTPSPYDEKIAQTNEQIENLEKQLNSLTEEIGQEPQEPQEPKKPTLRNKPEMSSDAIVAERKSRKVKDDEFVNDNFVIINNSGEEISEHTVAKLIPVEHKDNIYKFIDEYDGVSYRYLDPDSNEIWENVYTKLAENDNSSVCLGREIDFFAKSSVTIGNESATLKPNTVAIGYDAQADTANSLALGALSNTGVQHDSVASIGRVEGENTFTRRLIGVSDGINDTDAVTVGQLKAKLAELEKRLEALEGKQNPEQTSN